jgi:hypothetical protein
VDAGVGVAAVGLDGGNVEDDEEQAEQDEEQKGCGACEVSGEDGDAGEEEAGSCDSGPDGVLRDPVRDHGGDGAEIEKVVDAEADEDEGEQGAGGEEHVVAAGLAGETAKDEGAAGEGYGEEEIVAGDGVVQDLGEVEEVGAGSDEEHEAEGEGGLDHAEAGEDRYAEQGEQDRHGDGPGRGVGQLPGERRKAGERMAGDGELDAEGDDHRGQQDAAEEGTGHREGGGAELGHGLRRMLRQIGTGRSVSLWVLRVARWWEAGARVSPLRLRLGLRGHRVGGRENADSLRE